MSGESSSTGDEAGIEWKRHGGVRKARFGAAIVEVLGDEARLVLGEYGRDEEGDEESMADGP